MTTPLNTNIRTDQNATGLQILTKGERVYKCDVCNRRIRVPINKYSFDVVQRCIITQGCLGKLHKTILPNDINTTSSIPPAVTGLQDWFQRRVFYVHTQQIKKTEWTIKHNLANKPTIQVFVNDINDNLVEQQPTKIETIDRNTSLLIFDVEQSGMAECVTLSSENFTNPEVTTVTTITDFQLSNNGELTIATLNNNANINIDVIFKTSQGDIPVQYIAVDNIPSVNSSWAGSQTIHVAGTIYNVRSFNLLTHALGNTLFANNLIANGTAFYFPVLGATKNQNLILLSAPPYQIVDKITNKYIDMNRINQTLPEVYYSNREIFVAPPIIKNTYPPIRIID